MVLTNLDLYLRDITGSRCLVNTLQTPGLWVLNFSGLWVMSDWAPSNVRLGISIFFKFRFEASKFDESRVLQLLMCIPALVALLMSENIKFTDLPVMYV